MLAIADVRRSKQSKKNPSASPERQAAVIGEYCEGKGWGVDWYRDAEGHRSGKSEVGRPEWLRLKARLEAARPGEITAVVVYALDRSSRNAKDWFTFIDLLQKARSASSR